MPLLPKALGSFRPNTLLSVPNCPLTISIQMQAFNNAIDLNPNFAEAYKNMGSCLKEQDKIDEAITAYSKALSIKPDYEIARAMRLFLQAYICDWNINQEDSELIPSLGTSDKFVPPFSMLSFEDSPERHRLRRLLTLRN